MTEYGGFILKTILNEGQCSKPRGEIIFDRQMAKHDFVVIDLNQFNTFASTGGMPVGEIITSQTGPLVIGKILTVPKFATLDGYDGSVLGWSDQLARLHYRTADVIWYGINSIVVAHLHEGETAPGNTSLIVDSIQTDKRTDGKLVLRPGDGGDIISFHAGAAGDDILIGIMGRVDVRLIT